MGDDVYVRPATRADLDAINRIYNHEVRTDVATWELDEWSPERRTAWFRDRAGDEPVLVAEQAGAVVAFAYLTRYRGRRGYQYTRENTIFVAPGHQRAGVGRLLLSALIETARTLGLHTLVAWVDTQNSASIALHQALGYQVVGGERETGHKFGHWRSSVELQLMLDEAPAPRTPSP